MLFIYTEYPYTLQRFLHFLWKKEGQTLELSCFFLTFVLCMDEPHKMQQPFITYSHLNV